jgi:hypothetical protein
MYAHGEIHAARQVATFAPLLVWTILVTLVALSIVDAWSTWVLFRRGGIESNPLARLLIGQVGITGASVLRVVTGCTIATALARCVQLRPVRSTLVLVGATALPIAAWWGLTCVNNIRWLGKT